MVETCTDGSVLGQPVCAHPNLPVPTCQNGFAPVKVNDSDCCFHYECKSKCMGWGDSHLTFDGQYYAFQGNCTYVLVQEIIRKYNFSVHIKNSYCDISHSLACPESLIIYYESYKINLTQTRNPTVNKVFVNDVEMIPTISNKDFTITTSGIEITVDIPAIQAQINFRGTYFEIKLPFSLFYNNTEGLCGVYDNNKNNDCRLPNGQVQSCETAAASWEVMGNIPCHPPPPPSPTTPPTTTTKPCENTTQSDICNIIYSKGFEKCREVFPADYVYKACQFDTCHMGEEAGCYSLEAYARMCAEHSVCVDWRNSTNGLCPHSCPDHKVYKPCGPKVEKTCNSMYNEKFVTCESEFCNDNFREGCYCSEGTVLFNTETNQCTNVCGCVDCNGQPRQPGDKWNMNCEECICSMETFSTVCSPISCPPLESCEKPGYEIQTKNCCQTCEVKSVCVVSGIEYQPGDSVPGGLCETCYCGSKKDSVTNLHSVECSPVTCNTTCTQGYSYNAVPGKCCGECVPQHCVYTGPNNTIQTIEVGQSWHSSNEKCVTYNCTKVNNMFVLVKVLPVCPEFDEEQCIPGTETTTADGCCSTCVQQKCRTLTNNTYLESNNCISVGPVAIASCSGACVTGSIYSMAANGYMHTCSCCQELRTSQKQVQMHCPGKDNMTYTYTFVEECGCSVTECKDEQ
ncbi:intestinal mucin-like protein [Brachyhypopomus gauderio]|uniref:intestinal mucin-like protein n=1 Tax=Brachyhypopomus gauderio TaxID=698409 RepID=UPI004042C3D7